MLKLHTTHMTRLSHHVHPTRQPQRRRNELHPLQPLQIPTFVARPPDIVQPNLQMHILLVPKRRILADVE